MSPTTAVRFTLDERQSWDFACLSGDFNPLHVDAVAARRLQFGGTVCHGVHLVLQAFDLEGRLFDTYRIEEADEVIYLAIDAIAVGGSGRLPAATRG